MNPTNPEPDAIVPLPLLFIAGIITIGGCAGPAAVEPRPAPVVSVPTLPPPTPSRPEEGGRVTVAPCVLESDRLESDLSMLFPGTDIPWAQWRSDKNGVFRVTLPVDGGSDVPFRAEDDRLVVEGRTPAASLELYLGPETAWGPVVTSPPGTSVAWGASRASGVVELTLALGAEFEPATLSGTARCDDLSLHRPSAEGAIERDGIPLEEKLVLVGDGWIPLFDTATASTPVLRVAPDAPVLLEPGETRAGRQEIGFARGSFRLRAWVPSDRVRKLELEEEEFGRLLGLSGLGGGGGGPTQKYEQRRCPGPLALHATGKTHTARVGTVAAGTMVRVPMDAAAVDSLRPVVIDGLPLWLSDGVQLAAAARDLDACPRL
ncbi:MAG: hypothetical protein AAGN82_07060 [Myxococcota bacterium]